MKTLCCKKKKIDKTQPVTQKNKINPVSLKSNSFMNSKKEGSPAKNIQNLNIKHKMLLKKKEASIG